MNIEIIGAESLGVRGLCCSVKTKDRTVVIDPGVALGFRRNGLMPHPVQVIASERTRMLIEKALGNATDIVISHYHGDHIPLVEANPYQLSLERVKTLFAAPRLWTKGRENIPYNQTHRADGLSTTIGRVLTNAEGREDGPLSFSLPVTHGKESNHASHVMMTRIEDGGEVFVHASDIQMLDDSAISRILAWQPDIVLASGPPVYLQSLTVQEKGAALGRILHLAEEIGVLVLDHHLMRSRKGEQWLDYASSLSERRIQCAADFMGIPRNLLEADRAYWYKELPVPQGWHEAYAQKRTDVISEWSDKIAQVKLK